MQVKLVVGPSHQHERCESLVAVGRVCLLKGGCDLGGFAEELERAEHGWHDQWRQNDVQSVDHPVPADEHAQPRDHDVPSASLDDCRGPGQVQCNMLPRLVISKPGHHPIGCLGFGFHDQTSEDKRLNSQIDRRDKHPNHANGSLCDCVHPSNMVCVRRWAGKAHGQHAIVGDLPTVLVATFATRGI
eukprot:11228341-Lingulodinium_polyedra.AAC.1